MDLAELSKRYNEKYLYDLLASFLLVLMVLWLMLLLLGLMLILLLGVPVFLGSLVAASTKQLRWRRWCGNLNHNIGRFTNNLRLEALLRVCSVLNCANETI